jgi:hypothetical protein
MMATSCDPSPVTKPLRPFGSSTRSMDGYRGGTEWERATGTRPCARTIARRWGWRELLAEAIGVALNQVDTSWETVLEVRTQATLVALNAARDELGRWPQAQEWDAAGSRPSSRTFRRHFGSWADSCLAADRAPLGKTS